MCILAQSIKIQLSLKYFSKSQAVTNTNYHKNATPSTEVKGVVGYTLYYYCSIKIEQE